ncbi:MAG TPA: hypothetical protein VGR40_08125, partial [Candidatus Binatus sp.]|nr:hypothetical protein [Candidatus Binatus sp.]
IALERAVDEFECRVVASGLVRNHPQQVQGVGMAGSRLEDLAVDRFGLGETAGTMVRKAALEGLGDGDLDHGKRNWITCAA